MEHVLSEQQLAAFEVKYRRDTRITLSWQDLQDLTAEIRRCWAEQGRQDGLLGLQEKAIGALQARIEELEKSQGRSPKMFDDPCLSMAGTPEV